MKTKEAQTKKKLENLLKKHGYRRDDRPDHREWTKINSSFHLQIRLDQNNPDGWNGFQARLTTYMRWDIRSSQLERLLRFLKKEFT